ncbi:unnamed protein product [Gordionus sp. m RMFG-2023]
MSDDIRMGSFQPDPYDCITVDTRKFSFPHLSSQDIASLLDRSIVDWTTQSKNANLDKPKNNLDPDGKKLRAIWFKVGIADTRWIPILVEKGFNFHHAVGKRYDHEENDNDRNRGAGNDQEYLMMTKILSDESCLEGEQNGRKSEGGNENDVAISTHKTSLPPYAFTTIGVAGLVMHSEDEVRLHSTKKSSLTDARDAILKSRLLMIREKRRGNFWKFPGGLAEPGEELSVTASREVKEETGILTNFQGILSFRHSHTYLFGCSDLYFVCVLKATSANIQKDPGEIAQAEWVQIQKLLSRVETTADQNSSDNYPISESVKFLIDSYVQILCSELCARSEASASASLFTSKKVLSYDKKHLQTWYIDEHNNHM